MAIAVIGRPSWPHRPARVLPDRSQPDQGPAQEVIGERAWLLRDARSRALLGGGVLSAVTIALGLADTWTDLAVAYPLAWTAVILLGL